MKHATARLLHLALFSALVILAGCASSSKPGSGAWSDGTGATDSIYDGNPLGGRPDGANPDNADWDTLAPYTIYFAFDSFSIEAGERSKLQAIANWLQSNPGQNVVVAGHTDERGTLQYNIGLGERRALSVREFLIGLGVDGNRVITVSYGEERPAVPGSNETAWAKNRRAQTGILR
jgi:peptidoglycan-associated lipoprotein